MRVDRFVVRSFVLLCACASRPASPAAPQPDPVPVAHHGAPTEPSWVAPIEKAPTGQPVAVAKERPERCSIRVRTAAIYVDGDLMKRKDVVALCKQRSAALVELGEASDAEWQRLRADLVAAGVPILMRGVQGDLNVECASNPLSRGCM